MPTRAAKCFYRLEESAREVLGFQYVMPVHQGRAAEHLLAKAFVQPGSVVLMNYHFTTSKAHVDLAGGKVLELCADEALHTRSSNQFKGNMDRGKLEAAIREWGRERGRLCAHGSLHEPIGGQPFSMQNLKDVKAIAARHGIPLVFDGSLISEKRLLHSAARTRVADWEHSGHYPGDDAQRGYLLYVRTQERLGARGHDCDEFQRDFR
jgi:tryptophanase